MSNNEKLEELRAKKPNLYRVVCELATFEKPYAALGAVLKAGTGEQLKAEGQILLRS